MLITKEKSKAMLALCLQGEYEKVLHSLVYPIKNILNIIHTFLSFLRWMAKLFGASLIGAFLLKNVAPIS
ncbi:hypothetical protein KHP59_12720 [Virgibacillus sp. 19R1-5]|nr:hypothetical protein [Virgibacillus sp. 19R1-5]